MRNLYPFQAERDKNNAALLFLMILIDFHALAFGKHSTQIIIKVRLIQGKKLGIALILMPHGQHLVPAMLFQLYLKDLLATDDALIFFLYCWASVLILDTQSLSCH
ncbi:hypothetical protein SLA2020_326310 [Shorea laevis]